MGHCSLGRIVHLKFCQWDMHLARLPKLTAYWLVDWNVHHATRDTRSDDQVAESLGFKHNPGKFRAVEDAINW